MNYRSPKSIHHLVSQLILIALALFISGCIVGKSKIEISNNNPEQIRLTAVKVTSVRVENNQIKIDGSNFSKITKLQINDGSSATDLKIESITDNAIVANSVANISLVAGKMLDLVFSNAVASTAFTINFSLCDSLLGGKGINCTLTPNDRDVLSYDATSGKWKPRAVNGLSYQGLFDASAGSAPASSNIGDYYIINVAGTIGSVSYAVGDWIVLSAVGDWEKINNSSAITSVFGRTGAVVATKNDYDLNKMSDVDLTVAPVTGNVLKYNGTKWVAGTVAGGGGVSGVSGTAPISVANGATTPVVSITQSNTTTDGYLSSADWNTFNNKQAAITAGTTAQYYRGDKSWQTLNTTAVPEGTNLYFTNARVLGLALTGLDTSPTTAITAVDSILVALGKAQGQINTKMSSASFVDWSTTGVQTIAPSRLNLTTASRAVATDGTGVPTTTSVTATELGYLSGVTSAVQTQINNLSNGSATNSWTASGSDIYRASGKVGIGTTGPATTVDISSANTTILTLRSSNTGPVTQTLNFVDNGGTGSIASSWWTGLGMVLTAPRDISGRGFAFNSNGGTTRMFIDTSNGNVGIGTNAPNGILSVQPQQYATGTASQSGTTISGTGTTFTTSMVGSQFVFANGTSAGTITAFTDASTLTVSTSQTVGSQAYSIKYSGLNVLSFGYVGVGTTSPSVALEVTGGIKSTGQAGFSSGLYGSTGGIWVGDGQYRLYSIGGGINLESTASGGVVVLKTNNTSQLIVTNSGNVGIGTTSPAQKLSVNGIIESTLGGFKFPDGTTLASGNLGTSLLTGYAIDSGTKPTIAATDSINGAFGKVQKFLNDLNSDYVSKTATSQTVSGTFSFTSPISFLYSNTPTGTTPTEVANVQYVSNAIAANGVWNKSGSDINFTAGKVGIGTTSPGAPLHIVATDATLFLKATGTSSFSGINMFDNSGALAANFQYANASAPVLANSMFLGTRINAPLIFLTGSGLNERMRIDSTGNVGVGTTSPISQLSNNATNTGDASGYGEGSTAINWSQNSAGYVASFYNANTGTVGNGVLIKGLGTTTNALLSVDNGTGQATTGTALFRVLGNGNVGIGTTTPAYPLDVNGAISATNISPSIATLNSSNLNNGSWVNIATATITTQYINTQSIIEINGGQTGNGRSSTAIISWRVKQQNALGSVPYINLDLLSNTDQYLTAADFVNIITTNSASQTVCQLWMRINNSYESFSVQALQKSISNGLYGAIVMTPTASMSWSTTGSLPAGTQQFAVSSSFSQSASGYLSYMAGSVGIGIANPYNKFHIYDASNDIISRVESGAAGKTAATRYATGSASWSTGINLGVGSNKFTIADDNTTARMVIDSTGNIGFGTNSPAALLEVSKSGYTGSGFRLTDSTNAANSLVISNFGSGAGIIFDPQANSGNFYFGRNNSLTNFIVQTGNVGIGTSSPGYKLQVGVAADGSEARANAWNTLSDERLKKDFEIIPDSLEKLLTLNGYYYFWNRGTDTSRKLGLKAQEVQKVFPEVVSTGKDGFLSLSYNHLVAVVIEAVKEFYHSWIEDSHEIHRAIASKADVIYVQKIENENKKIKIENEIFKNKTNKLENENIKIKKENEEIKERLNRIEKMLSAKKI